MKYPEELLDFCKTETQSEIIESLIETQNSAQTSRDLNMTRSKVRNAIRMVESFAAQKGIHAHFLKDINIPHNLTVTGTSTYTKTEEGGQWTKTTADQAMIEANILQFVKSIQKDIIKAKPVKFNKNKYNKDIIPFINIGDAHLGMVAELSVTGEHFDQEIAKEELCIAMASVVEQLPCTERCVIQDMGDATHFESFHKVSLNSGHHFDGCEYSLMMEVYTEVFHFIVDLCLKKFKYVDFIINQGNHSASNDISAAISFRKYFENEPRLHVLDNRNLFIPYRMGNVLVVSHHGHKTKPESITNVIHTDFKKDAGECKFIYVDMAHIHTNKVLSESHGVVVESFNQLAAGDAYAHDNGWRSRKCLTAVLRSKTYGEKGRITIGREEVQDIAAKAKGVKSKAFVGKEVYTV